jgi:antitoxin component HigA of HigAB toxin-antitoxin module
MKKTIFRFTDLPKGYPSLCELHLPRPIHDKVGCENTLEIVETMAGFEKQFTKGQSDYFELLTDLVHAYEEEHEKNAPENNLPLKARLQHLLDSAGWSASDLGRFLGLDATMGNKILREERKLTAEHIRKLSGHFSLQAEYLL